jgi:hypothetical protein
MEMHVTAFKKKFGICKMSGKGECLKRLVYEALSY